MPQADVEMSNGWAVAVRQRRKALLQRLGMGAACALVFSPLLGWTFGLLWVTGYFLIQLIDLMVFAPINSSEADRMPLGRSVAGGLMLVLNGTYFGSLSIPLWLVGGPMGGVCAAIMLSAGAIYSVINAPRSNLVMILTSLGQFLYLAATPFFMLANGASTNFATAAGIAVGVFVAYCVSTWQRMDASRRSEIAARIDADRRRIEAERMMESRSAFLAAVGHDLRTPISAIMAGSSELERGAGDATSRSHARLIGDAGLMMKALLDDLLDHAKLEAGRMTVEEGDFNLRSLIAQTARLWQGPARAKGLKLRIEGAAQIPSMVRGDAMRLRQILNNLVSNAMKFTDAGSITLVLTSWEDETEGHAVLIEVRDTGPGMTAAQVSRLFTPFDQTADGISARHGGTGLGLTISRDLAQLMGGRLTARSAPGQGASFTLSVRFGHSDVVAEPVAALDSAARAVTARALAPSTLSPGRPLPIVEPQTVDIPSTPVADADPEPSQDDEEGRPLRVLVVDDHDINRRAIQLILQPLGCDVTTAADGMAALTACEGDVFDVIFMDVRMPELDGRETTRRIRSQGGPNAATPVIAVTADTAPEDIAACMAAGMTYFVPKPITPATLLGAVTHVLSGDTEEPVERETEAA